MIYYFFISFFAGLVFAYSTYKFATKFGILDKPDKERKFHGRSVPLLGGVSIFFAFWLIVAFLVFFKPIYGITILNSKLFAAFISSVIILMVGIVDDIKPLPAKLRLMITSIAVFVAVYLGLRLERLTNPFGGYFSLSLWLGNILVFFWLLGMMYTTKITDGLDGLSAGVVSIGSLMIFFLSNSQRFYQPNVALLSIIFFGVCAGFLMLNFYPAKIFLGESGSLLIGFLLGVLAVISGGKLATALLVMSIPVFDLVRVIYIRFRQNKPVFEGDRMHLHYQLASRGFSERAVVLIYYGIAFFLGALGFLFQSAQKIFALGVVLLFMITIGMRWRRLTK